MGLFNLFVRGGVEGTRLEAKDTKQFRVQGQGQTLSRPRPRTSKCVLKNVLDAKNVLEDSTFAICNC